MPRFRAGLRIIAPLIQGIRVKCGRAAPLGGVVVYALVAAVIGPLAARGAAAADAVPALVLYVAPGGNDAWSGLLAEPNAQGSDGPLASVVRARDRLREINPSGGALVRLRGGTYRLREPLILTPEDSGDPGSPRVYESYPGERAILSGTQPLSGQWRSAGEHLWEIDVGSEAVLGTRSLFVDGVRATWARFPNEGYLRATGGREKAWIEVPPGKASTEWARDPQATVNIIAEHGWYNQIVRIAAVGEAGDWIQVAGREAQGRIWPGNRFYVEGVRRELDAEGEWYLDRTVGKLLYFSRRSPESRRFELAVVDRLIEVRGRVGQPVHDLSFRRLAFFGSDFTVDHVAVRTSQDAALHLVNARDLQVSECYFDSVGGYAVWLHLDCRNNVIQGNEMVRSGAGGVLLTAARFSYASDQDVFDPDPLVQAVAPSGNVILDNHIHHGGVIRAYCSGVHLDSRPLSLSRNQGNYIGFNRIHDMPRNGIFGFRNQGGNIIEANHIHDVLQQTNDGGAIHLASMNPQSAPTEITGNHIYRVGYQEGATKVSLAFGIYCDWFTSQLAIRGNVVSDTRDGGIRLLGGDDILIVDNLVGDDPTGSVVFGRWMTRSVRNIVMRHNLVVNSEGPWVRYFTSATGASPLMVAEDPSRYWSSFENRYVDRGTGGGIHISRDARGVARADDHAYALVQLQQRGAETGSLVVDCVSDLGIDVSREGERFGEGHASLPRLRRLPSLVDVRRRLEALESPAVLVSFADTSHIVENRGWATEPAKINDFLAFADLKQAVARESGASIAFVAQLAPGRYTVFVKWYGAAAERAPQVEVELAAPGRATELKRIDHRQEGHKWVSVGAVEVTGEGDSVVRLTNVGGGATAVNAVAWVQQSDS